MPVLSHFRLTVVPEVDDFKSCSVVPKQAPDVRDAVLAVGPTRCLSGEMSYFSVELAVAIVVSQNAKDSVAKTVVATESGIVILDYPRRLALFEFTDIPIAFAVSDWR